MRWLIRDAHRVVLIVLKCSKLLGFVNVLRASSLVRFIVNIAVKNHI